MIKSSEWQLIPLRRVMKSAQSGFASGARDVEGVIQLRMNNVTTDGTLDWTSFIRVPASEKQLDKYRLRRGDVLFNSTNSPNLVGKTAMFVGYTEPVVFSNHFVRLRVDDTKLEPRYLACWLTYRQQQRFFESICTQWVNQAAVRKDDLLSLQLPLPPLPEQKRIAAILAKADRLRRLRRYARDLSDTYLQSVFLEMFGDPVSNPMGWPTAEIQEITESLDQRRIPIEASIRKFRRGEYPYYGASGIIDYIDDYIFDEETLLVAEDGANLRARVTPIAFKVSGKYWVNNHAHVLRMTERVNIDFLCQVLNATDLEPYVTGTAQPKLTATKLKRISVILPPVPLQQHFAHIVHKFERLRAQQREAERQAEHLFQTLLHRAFRGEL